MQIPEALTRKLGPLPTWGWGVAIIGGYAVFRLFRKGGSGDGSGIYSLGPGGAGGIEPNTGGGGSGSPTTPTDTGQQPNTPTNPQTPTGPGAPGGGGGVIIPTVPWWESFDWLNLFPRTSPTSPTPTPTGSSPTFTSGAYSDPSRFAGIASDIGSLIGSWDTQLPPLLDSAAPERTLPGTIYAGTVGASTLTPEQASMIQYNTPEFEQFVNAGGQDQGQTEYTLNTLVNYRNSGGYAGTQADLDAAIITAANSEVARIQQYGDPTLSRDQIIRSMAPTTRAAIEDIEGRQSTTGLTVSPGAPRSYAVPVPT